MKRHTATRLLPLAVGVGALLLALLPRSATAQDADGFLFRRPWVTLGFNLGYALPTASSDVFDFTTEQLTVDRTDFGAVALQAEFAVRATEKLDVVAGASWAADQTTSEFRDWIGTDNLPIQQTTRFSRVPLTLGVKWFLHERGRSLGNFAWVPTKWSPYVGAAAGAVWYEFEQQGEFVDYQTLDIFRDLYLSNGWAPTAHFMAGMDYTLLPRLALTAEARYSWAKSKLSRDFVDFDDIDLAGLQATAGISLRF
jgi:outer membrane protein W